MWYFVQEIDSIFGHESYVFYKLGSSREGFRRWACNGWNWAVAWEFINYLNSR